ncbi:hypothetical protein CONLIGDRAFT_675145 [Coniochaeta ligniaria NRRL 30616]|uniref:Uncharacterized protein n=1 Tax=Coniochaeta ligniaria NRRL 30616 TaxID=1408157 RepID=A0A1J7J457_9PEZI|nr:hypothetical protein CONLIGDRAFT_675145 [Coniochaeta ligniaria NRRL 30616]
MHQFRHGVSTPSAPKQQGAAGAASSPEHDHVFPCFHQFILPLSKGGVTSDPLIFRPFVPALDAFRTIYGLSTWDTSVPIAPAASTAIRPGTSGGGDSGTEDPFADPFNDDSPVILLTLTLKADMPQRQTLSSEHRYLAPQSRQLVPNPRTTSHPSTRPRSPYSPPHSPPPSPPVSRQGSRHITGWNLAGSTSGAVHGTPSRYYRREHTSKPQWMPWWNRVVYDCYARSTGMQSLSAPSSSASSRPRSSPDKANLSRSRFRRRPR